jgi:hypothetical protein
MTSQTAFSTLYDVVNAVMDGLHFVSVIPVSLVIPTKEESHKKLTFASVARNSSRESLLRQFVPIAIGTRVRQRRNPRPTIAALAPSPLERVGVRFFYIRKTQLNNFHLYIFTP